MRESSTGRARGRRAPRRSAVPSSLRTRTCRSAKQAICGRWVTTSTWRVAASRASRRPTASPAWPPMPASTSSNTSVGTSSRSASTLRHASITRDSSPPLAAFASGSDGCDVPPRNRSSTRSAPDGPGLGWLDARPRSRHRACRARVSCAVSASGERGAAARRRARRPRRRAPRRSARRRSTSAWIVGETLVRRLQRHAARPRLARGTRAPRRRSHRICAAAPSGPRSARGPLRAAPGRRRATPGRPARREASSAVSAASARPRAASATASGSSSAAASRPRAGRREGSAAPRRLRATCLDRARRAPADARRARAVDSSACSTPVSPAWGATASISRTW